MKKSLITILLTCLLAATFVVPAQAAESVKYGRYPNAESKMFVTDDDYFYYVMFSSEKTPYSLVKQAKDGSAKTVIHTTGDYKIQNLNLMDGWFISANRQMCIGFVPTAQTLAACTQREQLPAATIPSPSGIFWRWTISSMCYIAILL